jgi:hypothetical protein
MSVNHGDRSRSRWWVIQATCRPSPRARTDDCAGLRHLGVGQPPAGAGVLLDAPLPPVGTARAEPPSEVVVLDEGVGLRAPDGEVALDVFDNPGALVACERQSVAR